MHSKTYCTMVAFSIKEDILMILAKHVRCNVIPGTLCGEHMPGAKRPRPQSQMFRIYEPHRQLNIYGGLSWKMYRGWKMAQLHILKTIDPYTIQTEAVSAPSFLTHVWHGDLEHSEAQNAKATVHHARHPGAVGSRLESKRHPWAVCSEVARAGRWRRWLDSNSVTSFARVRSGCLL